MENYYLRHVFPTFPPMNISAQGRLPMQLIAVAAVLSERGLPSGWTIPTCSSKPAPSQAMTPTKLVLR